MTTRTLSRFKKAEKQAKKSECNYRLGAIVSKQKVLGFGFNQRKTHTLTNKDMYAEKLKGVHAEIAACLKTSRTQLDGAEIYVCRLLKNDDWAMSRPCDICMEIMKRFGIKRIYYTIRNNEFGVVTV